MNQLKEIFRKKNEEYLNQINAFVSINQKLMIEKNKALQENESSKRLEVYKKQSKKFKKKGPIKATKAIYKNQLKNFEICLKTKQTDHLSKEIDKNNENDMIDLNCKKMEEDKNNTSVKESIPKKQKKIVLDLSNPFFMSSVPSPEISEKNHSHLNYADDQENFLFHKIGNSNSKTSENEFSVCDKSVGSDLDTLIQTRSLRNLKNESKQINLSSQSDFYSSKRDY